MHELTLALTEPEWATLQDYVDATERTPEEVAREVLIRHLHREGDLVRHIAERIADSHGELLRRLGE
ncbi:hypothetical protein [Streptomyces jeddahensis]|uniref:CopG family transcriptional regulator n=1 Tax=Streptomyces jeddahensis TaxID=1716141 RepID=A0A177HWQ8_9ACTN|nr:hypothetical protein [Streptomyces jeddahensis]OAH15126.1 hypothetical protein STSP_15050 [Streptomyces jeddahensis]